MRLSSALATGVLSTLVAIGMSCGWSVVDGDADADADGDADSDGDGDGDADGDGDGDECTEPPAEVVRIDGADRYEIAAALSAGAFASASHVVVANGDGEVCVDSLVGAPLATELGGPVLVVPPDAVPAAACTEIGRLGAASAHVVGGTSVVAAAAVTALGGCGATSVDRFAGADAADTSARVAMAVEMSGRGHAAVVGPAEGGSAMARYLGPAAFLATGEGLPLLLVSRDSVPETISSALATLEVEQVTVVAPAEAIADATLATLPGAERLAVESPAQAAALVAARLLDRQPGRARVSIVWSDADSLAPEAAAAAATGTLVLLAGRSEAALPEPTATFLHENRCRIGEVAIVGGEDVIPASVEAELGELLDTAPAGPGAIESVLVEPVEVEYGGTVTITVALRVSAPGGLSDGAVWIEATPPAGEVATQRTEGLTVAEGEVTDVVQVHGPLEVAGRWSFWASLHDSTGALLDEDPAVAVTVRPRGGLGAFALGTTVEELGAAEFARQMDAGGFDDVFLLVKGASGSFRFTVLDALLDARDAAGYSFHVWGWVICFQDEGAGGWVDPSDAAYRARLIDEVLTPLLRDREPDGVVLDGVRYNGTAAGRTAAVTSFVEEARILRDGLRPAASLAATIVPALAATAQDHGQDCAALAAPLDVLIPLAYTTENGQGTAWVGQVTEYVVGQVGAGAEVWTALQSTDATGGQVAADRLGQEAAAGVSAGATGISFFRYPYSAEQLTMAREIAF